MDAMIIGPPRSGTTALAGLMTFGARHRIYNEPGSTRRGMGAIKRDRPATAKWGVKEVRPGIATWWLSRYSVARIVVTVRNPRHIALSLWDAHRKKDRPVRTLDRQIERLRETTRWIVQFVDDRDVRICRYETFCEREGYRQQLSEWLDWPFSGDPNHYQRRHLTRRFEVDRHHGAITNKSIRVRRQERRPEALEFAEVVAQECVEYARRFYP